MTTVARSIAGSLGRASYRDIALYAPDRTPCAIDLSDNTNRHGVAPAVTEAIGGADVSVLSRYPSLYAGSLKEQLAAYTRVTPDSVVTGCGSDDVLDSAIRAFAEPGETVAFATPTFPMIPIFAQMNGLRAVEVPFLPGFQLDADALLEADARIIYICSPNNPTGTTAGIDTIGRLIESTSALVIIDEAYIEYAGTGFAQQAADCDNVLVTRTMSKAFGLAGLRVGYAVGHPAVIAGVEKSRGPYKVSSIAERAALAALSEGMSWMREHVAKDVRARDRLFNELRAFGLQPIPSQANFVLVPVPNAPGIALSMRQKGVAVRPFASLPGIGDALRISVGPWPMVETCLDALRSALQDVA